MCSMSQDNAKSIFIKLIRYLDSVLKLGLKSLRRNICDIEVFDGVLS